MFVSSVSNGLGQPELHAFFLAFSVLACIIFVLLVPQLNRTGEQLYEVKVGLTREMRSRHSGDVSSTSASCTRSIPILFCSLLKLVAVCTEPRDVARGHYRLSASAAFEVYAVHWACSVGFISHYLDQLLRKHLLSQACMSSLRSEPQVQARVCHQRLQCQLCRWAPWGVTRELLKEGIITLPAGDAVSQSF